MTRLPLTVVIAAACLAACTDAPQVVDPIAAVVEIAAPIPTGDQIFVTGIGRLEADDQASLAFTTAGVIASIDVDIGDRVQPGQTLARLDSTVLDASAREAEEQVTQAKRDLDRAEGLVARQLVARQQLDDAQTALQVAEARLRAARFGQRFGRVVSTGSGRVLARLAEPGEVIAAGQPVLRVSGNEQGWVLPVTLADRDGLNVKPGALADVRFDALPGRTLKASVARVAGEANATSGGFVVELAIAGQGEPLRSGLIGKARITTREDAIGVRIPTSALLNASSDGARVFVVDEGRASLRQVRLGEVRGDGVTVLEGLDANDAIVVGGAAFLADGATVVAEPRS